MHIPEHSLPHVTSRSAKSASLGAKELHGGTSPMDQYSDFQKLLPRKQKANEKSLPIITSKHIDLESKGSRLFSHAPAPADPWKPVWHSKHRDLRKSLNPRGLAKYYRQFSLVPVTVRNKERRHN